MRRCPRTTWFFCPNDDRDTLMFYTISWMKWSASKKVHAWHDDLGNVLGDLRVEEPTPGHRRTQSAQKPYELCRGQAKGKRQCEHIQGQQS